MKKFNFDEWAHLKMKDLTDKQIQICEKLLIHGNHQDVADSLFLCVKTIKYHVSGVYKKLKVTGKHGLIFYLGKLTQVYAKPEEIKPIEVPPAVEVASDEVILPKGLLQ